MQLPKKECIHIVDILKKTKSSLVNKNPTELKDLSNQTIHDACNYQDEASITIAVLLYTLSKLIERNDFKKIRNCDMFVRKFNSILDLAIKAIEEDKIEAYQSYIQQARKTLESQAINLKPYIQDVLRKAAINKGSKLYEHGISIEKTSKLLGVSQWELLDYVGQKATEAKQYKTISTKQRAKMAMEFFG